MSRANNRPDADDDARYERRRTVAELRLHGRSQREIARALDVSHATVQRDLTVIKQEWADAYRQSYETHVGTVLARLNQLERSIAKDVTAGELRAVSAALAILDRQARLLGLDAPTRHEVRMVTVDDIDMQIAELERQLANARAIEGDVIDVEVVEETSG